MDPGGGVAHEEDVLLQFIQVFSTSKDDVLCHQNIVEWFNVLVAVFYRDSVSKADTPYLYDPGNHSALSLPIKRRLSASVFGSRGKRESL